MLALQTIRFFSKTKFLISRHPLHSWIWFRRSYPWTVFGSFLSVWYSEHYIRQKTGKIHLCVPLPTTLPTATFLTMVKIPSVNSEILSSSVQKSNCVKVQNFCVEIKFVNTMSCEHQKITCILCKNLQIINLENLKYQVTFNGLSL